LQAAGGCDSIVTLTLAVLPSVTGTASANICQGSSYNFNGLVLNTAGVYIDTFGFGQRM